MKLKLVYIVNSIILFLITSPLLAQDPTDPGSDPDPAPPAPIDDYIWVLLVIGLFYGFMKFRAIQNNKIQN
jgi:hypothetical protein